MPKVGMRMIKTSIAVFLCFLVDLIRQDGIPFYSAIAAVLCMQSEITDSKEKAKSRIIATIIGGIAGMVFLNIENVLPFIVSDWLRYVAISLCLIPILYFTVIIKKPSSSYLSCVVFMCITVVHVDDSHATLFAINRILDTLIGIVISLGVNQFRLPFLRKKDIYVLPLDSLDTICIQNSYHLKKYLNIHPHSILYTSKIPALIFKNISTLPLTLPIIVKDGAAIFDIQTKQYASLQVIPHDTVEKIQNIFKQYSIPYFCYEVNQEQMIIHYQELNSNLLKQYNLTKHMEYIHYFHHHLQYHLEHDVVCFEIIEDIDTIKNIQTIVDGLPITCFYQEREMTACLKVYAKDISLDKQISFIKKNYQIKENKIHFLSQQDMNFSKLKQFYKGELDE